MCGHAIVVLCQECVNGCHIGVEADGLGVVPVSVDVVRHDVEVVHVLC